MKAPEKIYIFEEDLQREDHIVMYGINQDKDIKGLVEYTHTDAFIEKAWEWVEDNMLSSNQQDKSRLYYEQFKNHMEGE